jgi:hypothetical protein
MKWEGSSWEGYEPSEDAQLRYGLIVPRLLAPHPNRGAEGSLRPDQGLALAVLVRIHNLQSYLSELDDMPDFNELGQSPDWRWRLLGAFFERLEGNTHDASSVFIRTITSNQEYTVRCLPSPLVTFHGPVNPQPCYKIETFLIS